MVVARLLSRVSERDVKAAFLFAVASYVLFSVLDVMSTLVALGSGLHERNSLGVSVYATYGPAGLWALKGIVVVTIVAVLAVLPRRVSVWVATALALMTAIAVIANLQVLSRVL